MDLENRHRHDTFVWEVFGAKILARNDPQAKSVCPSQCLKSKITLTRRVALWYSDAVLASKQPQVGFRHSSPCPSKAVVYGHCPLTCFSKSALAWTVSQHTDATNGTIGLCPNALTSPTAPLGCVPTQRHQQKYHGVGCVPTQRHQQEHQGVGCVPTH